MEAPPKRSWSDRAAGLRQVDGGALSSVKVERYALLRAEGVLAPTACWAIAMSSKNKNLPSNGYKANIHSNQAFKRRLEELMSEKEALEAEGVWGRAAWQARQLYRFAVAREDLGKMMAATDQLMKIALHEERMAGVVALPADAEEAEQTKRGRGAPPIETPMPGDGQPNYRANALLEK